MFQLYWGDGPLTLRLELIRLKTSYGPNALPMDRHGLWVENNPTALKLPIPGTQSPYAHSIFRQYQLPASIGKS